MNLTGAQLYSRAASGLRQPGTKLLDQQFKLVFIYPMLFDVKLQGKYSNDLKSFIVVSMLKEIFVSNALNIVALASKDHPLVDEHGKKIDVDVLAKKSIASYGGFDTGEQQTQVSFPSPGVDTYSLQQKIKEKTAIIKKYLATEPRLKKLTTYVEFITLDNMIDVPVIVGAKDYQIDSLTLAFILAASISLDKPLDKIENVNFIFRVLSNMDEEKAWTLFDNLIRKNKISLSEKILNWVRDSLTSRVENPDNKPAPVSSLLLTLGRLVPSRGIAPRRSMDPRILKSAGERIEYDPKSGVYRDLDDPSKTYDPRLFGGKPQRKFDILSVVQNNLQQAHLFFKFMLDDSLLLSQFGLSKSPGQMETVGTRISPHAQDLLDQSHQLFLTYVQKNINDAMKSAFVSLTPVDKGVDYAKFKKEYFSPVIVKQSGDIVNNLGSYLSNAFINADPKDSKNRITKVNKLCDKLDVTVFTPLRDLNYKVRGSEIPNLSFNYDTFEKYVTSVDKTASGFSDIIKQIENDLKKFIPNVGSLLDDIAEMSKNAIDAMLDKYEENYDSEGTDNRFANAAICKSQDLISHKTFTDEKSVTDYINEIRYYLIDVINCHFLAAMLPAICGYIDNLDVEVETVMNDVLDLPNYSLVVPVETIAMLHAAIISKNWRDLVQRGMTQNTNLNDNYIKGIVKFIHSRINVPNLIVIDDKSGQVFYKLQYMSQVNKSNINTLKAYVQHSTKEELDSSQY